MGTYAAGALPPLVIRLDEGLNVEGRAQLGAWKLDWANPEIGPVFVTAVLVPEGVRPASDPAPPDSRLLHRHLTAASAPARSRSWWRM
jgi:hypothetical protein